MEQQDNPDIPGNTRTYGHREANILSSAPAWNRGLRPTRALCLPTLAMEITQQIREFAKEKGLDTEEAVTAGLTSKSEEFTEAGGEIYS